MRPIPLDIIYQDIYCIAINKPHGLLVHRSPIAADASEFAVQQLRDQIGARVYPVHRLDRKTAGVLLFALTPEMNSALQRLFERREVNKVYHAIVRGYTDDNGLIDYPIKKENGEPQEAITVYKTLHRVELDIPFGKHNTSRYSSVELQPQTGRMHQLRQHMAHIFHPIIGDRPYGCNKQNRLWKEKWNMITMLLHASKLSFAHPVSREEIEISAPCQTEFGAAAEMLFGQDFKNYVNSSR